MNTEPYQVEHVAGLFWELARQTPSYPVPLEDVVGWAFPLAISHVPGLSVQYVRAWLQANGILYTVTKENRRLRGCLFAYRGNGVIFLDSTDPADEQRFTLAHELAHFLLDYWLPRQRTLETLGEPIQEVLDGERAPTTEERLHAVLANTSLGVLSHLMERPDVGIPTAVVLEVEERADQLALEIIAPANLLIDGRDVNSQTVPYITRLQTLVTTLKTSFGLPSSVARPYARMLLSRCGGPSIRDWLFGTDR